MGCRRKAMERAMDANNKRNRTDLKSYFVKNAIPTASNFADLIEGMLNQKDDGIIKLPGDPLSIEASGDDTSLKKTINFYRNFGDANPDWTISLNPRGNPNDASTAKSGFNISDGEGHSRLFIDRNTGNVGIGTTMPDKRLHLEAGELKIRASHNNTTADLGTFYAQNLARGIGIGPDRIEAIGSNAAQDILFLPKGSGAVSVQKDAVLQATNEHHIEIFSGNTGDPYKYTKIRFHQLDQYWGWLGYHNSPSGNIGEFSFWDLKLGREARIRASGISSPMWKVTRLFDRRRGPLPVEAQFTSNGGTLVVFTSGSGWRTSGGMMSLQISIDDKPSMFIDVTNNELNSHKTFPTTVGIVPELVAGQHTFRISSWEGTTTTDENDRFYATIMELPF
jgi:hypothetical protein